MLLNYSLKPQELKQYSRYGDITHLCYDGLSAKMDRDSFADTVWQDEKTVFESLQEREVFGFDGRNDDLESHAAIFAMVSIRVSFLLYQRRNKHNRYGR